VACNRGTNKLDTKARRTILNMLVEELFMRSISQITGVLINRASKFLADAGRACAAYHDESVRNVNAQRI